MLRPISFVFLCLTMAGAFAATYQVKFTGTWNAGDVSSSYPISAHFSEMIGTTHNAATQIWRVGGTASKGVEDVAELGFNSPLISEISALRQTGSAGDTIQFDSLFNLPSSNTMEIKVDDDKPFITLISMIAPSPDWFVGVSALPLKNGDAWLPRVNVDLRPYDAGTEDGDTFSLSNPASSSGVIRQLDNTGSPFIGRPVIGKLEFTLLEPIPSNNPPAPPPGIPSLQLSPVISFLLDSQD